MSTGVITREGTVVPPDQIVRYTFRERLCHWINALAYSYAMLTGLALFTPHLYWIAAVLGGGPTIRFWHPWIGLIFFVTIFWMHALWRSDMVHTERDREWTKNVKYYIQNRDDMVPAQGRFNAGQKQFYWIMFWSAIVLLVTGIIMWIPETLSGSVHWLLPIIIFIHSAVALITIGAIIIHIYMGLWMTPGSLKAMMEGHVSRQWARVHHRLWFDKVTGARSGPR
jgi:formate dehydrogenase subunit gamma